ncbi:MAG: hypothetical protein AAGB12_16690 [Pseudomonadota bacterium]
MSLPLLKSQYEINDLRARGVGCTSNGIILTNNAMSATLTRLFGGEDQDWTHIAATSVGQSLGNGLVALGSRPTQAEQRRQAEIQAQRNEDYLLSNLPITADTFGISPEMAMMREHSTAFAITEAHLDWVNDLSGLTASRATTSTALMDSNFRQLEDNGVRFFDDPTGRYTRTLTQPQTTTNTSTLPQKGNLLSRIVSKLRGVSHPIAAALWSPDLNTGEADWLAAMHLQSQTMFDNPVIKSNYNDYVANGGVKDIGQWLAEGGFGIDSRHLALVTGHPNAHSLSRHGGSVTDEQLMHRALTGEAPDGHVKLNKKGVAILPPMSSAFHSDELLIYADQYVRKNILPMAIANTPDANTILVTPQEVGDIGVDLGRGYVRIGGSKYRPNIHGAPQFINNLNSVQGTYQYNPSLGVWETITIFPAR